MANKASSLFEAVVPVERFNANFQSVRELDKFAPARWMLDDVFSDFHDKDGNFVEQFQTQGFDARVFELYLFAYFSRSGFTVINKHSAPDFLVERDGIRFGIEVTTLNPSTSGILFDKHKAMEDMSDEEFDEYTSNEMCIRFGSALNSKVKRGYWDHPHIKGLPFVIAIEAFNDPRAIFLSSSSLTTYLYGVKENVEATITDGIRRNRREYDYHSVGSKIIRSKFFEHAPRELSAILFTNSGTVGKFNRMGYAHGIHNDRLLVQRAGFFLDESPTAFLPAYISYDLDNPPFVEDWGHGSVVFHNPHALHNVPDSAFSGLMQHRVIDGKLKSLTGILTPLSTSTRTELIDPEHKATLKHITIPRCCLQMIPQEFLSQLANHLNDYSEFANYFQCGGFTDATESFYGILLKHKITERVKFIILALNKYGSLIPVYRSLELNDWDNAKNALISELSTMLNRPQRYWPEVL